MGIFSAQKYPRVCVGGGGASKGFEKQNVQCGHKFWKLPEAALLKYLRTSQIFQTTSWVFVASASTATQSQRAQAYFVFDCWWGNQFKCCCSRSYVRITARTALFTSAMSHEENERWHQGFGSTRIKFSDDTECLSRIFARFCQKMVIFAQNVRFFKT